MADEESMIRAEGLVKRFGDLVAVDGLSLDVRKGELYGFLGPNGAGKTTTVRMLTTMEIPDEGSIAIDGLDARDRVVEVRRLIGVIQQHNSLDKDLTVRENLLHHALMQNLSFKEAKKRIEEFAGIMELQDRMETKVDKLSGGWKKKVSIACSIMHRPEILFMDEPTTGLDTQSRNLLWKLIRGLNKDGTTVFLTTHYIFEAESLCDRVGIINKGRLIAEGTPEELKRRVGAFALVSVGPDGEESVSYHPDSASARAASADVPPDSSISIRPTNLEDVFLELTGRRIRCTIFPPRCSGWPTATSAT
jgi:ABC-2 type transport system ATP-binding protein